MQRAMGVIVAMGVVMMAAPCWADEFSPGPVRKLSRGIANITFGLWELPIAIQETNETEGTVAATTFGVIAGLVASLRRTTAGIYETLTFPFPNPLVNYDPLIHPEFLRVAGKQRL